MAKQITSGNRHIRSTQAWLRVPAKEAAGPGNSRRKSSMARLMAGASASAAILLLVLAPRPVSAQAVVGTPTPQFGISSIIRGPSTDTVNVQSFEALLDWDATSTTGVFLPEGNTLRFDGGDENYTILNRVTSSAFGGPLSISGRVETEGANGKVWFYNPGGWVVGATGVFNVGSLVLTSLPIAVDPSTDIISRLSGDNGEIRFGAAPVATSSVTINGGAQVNAQLGSGSYVAIVAPRVSQGGTVQVDGSTAYVGASAATVTINNGLFDIVVDSGTDDATGVSHTGTTTGPAANLSDPNHRIYLVAVPKNQAMTAVVAGSLGYAPATNASFEADGSIVLSAGYDIEGGSVSSNVARPTNASLRIAGLSSSNDVTGYAGGAITVDAVTANITLAKNGDLQAQGDINVNVGTGRTLAVGGALALGSSSTTTSGNIAVTLSSGSAFSVAGDLSVISSANGLVKLDPDNGDVLDAGSIGDNARSGNVSVVVRDANFTVGGQMALMSEASGGIGELSAGSAQSGDVSFAVLQDNPASPVRSVSLADVQLGSNAFSGSFNAPQIPVAGSQSTSGNVTFAVDGGLLTGGRVDLDSSSFASAGSNLAVQQASAGRVGVSFANSADIFRLTSLELGNSAYAVEGGVVAIGDVGLALDAADLTINNGFFSFLGLTSDVGGTLVTPNVISLSLRNGSALDLGTGFISLDAYASDALDSQISGNIAITIDNSSLSLGGFQARASAFARNSGAQGVAGDIALVIRNGGSLSALNSVRLHSFGYGGNGFDGGDGVGGSVSFDLDNSTFAASSFDQRSIGTAGFPDDPAGSVGTGRGGEVRFQQTGSTSDFEVVSFDMQASGEQSSNEGSFSSFSSGPSGGAGADGLGGSAAFTVDDGSFTVDTLRIFANGEGGSGVNFDNVAPGRGGNGTGGTASLLVQGGTVQAETLEVSASGFGGVGARVDGRFVGQAGHGGNGTGGVATVTLTGGTLVSDDVQVSANGNKSVDFGYGFVRYYGSGGSVYYSDGTAGTGGIGQGGNALLTIDGGALLKASDSSTVQFSVSVNAFGEGGAGGETYSDTTPSDYLANSGSGGNAVGGTAAISYLSGVFDAEAITIDASGLGAPAGNDANQNGQLAIAAGAGGSGTGGVSRFTIGTDFSELTSSDDQRFVVLIANGNGRSGENGTIGGAGGNGTGGSAIINATGGTVTLEAPELSAVGSAGDGGSSSLDSIGGDGGNAKGGLVSIASDGDGTRLAITNHRLAAFGQGGFGGNGGSGSDLVDGAGNGGDGGSGEGGRIAFTASSLGQLDLLSTVDTDNVVASGNGGDGGLGGNASFNGWTSTGSGGAGGAGIGGAIAARAEAGGTLTFGLAEFAVSGEGGFGGGLASFSQSGALQASTGGAGGTGRGGSFSLVATGGGSKLEIGALSVFAEGYGGDGASGTGNDTLGGFGATGGAGGAAFGGTISFTADDSGELSIAEAGGALELIADAYGGEGGQGAQGLFNSSGFGGTGGAGGDSGSGQGGAISIEAVSLGLTKMGLTGTSFLQANGTSGLAGNGGRGADVNFSDPNARGGNGGNSGLGNGGNGGVIAFSASGGQLSAGILDVDALGVSNAIQDLAPGGSGPGGSGSFGTASFFDALGGTVTFTSSDNLGGFVAGSTDVAVTSGTNYVSANGSFFIENGAGSIALTNSSSRAVDGMRFAQFVGNATGSGGAQPGITIAAISGTVQIDSDLTLSAFGAITLDMDGDAGVSVGGAASLRSDGGIAITGMNAGQFSATSITLDTVSSIDIASIACPDLACSPVHATGLFTAEAGGNFNLFGPATVAGLDEVSVYAGNAITGASRSGFFSNGNVQLRGGGDVTIRNALGNDISVSAGTIVDGSTLYFPATLTLGEVAGTGLIRAAGNVSFTSGGGIFVTDGNIIEAAARTDFVSGNDIVVGANNRIGGNTALPVTALPLQFRAGGLPVNYTLASSDIATLAIGAGTIVDANNGAIILSGAAIDARQALFLGSRLQADVTRALTMTAPRRNDGGRLDPDCLEGAICMGSAEVSGSVAIGQGSIMPRDVRITGSLSGLAVSVAALGDIIVGAPETQTSLDSIANTTLVSSQGSIGLLQNASLRGDNVALSGAGSLTGAGYIEGLNDVGLTFGGDIDADTIIAGRELTTASGIGGSPDGAFTTPGSLRVSSLSLGSDADLAAGIDMVIGTLSVPGANVRLQANSLLSLGAVLDVRDLDLAASAVNFGNLGLSGNLTVTAGSVVGNSASAGGTLQITSDDLAANALESVNDLTLTVVNTAELGIVRSSAGAVDIDPVSLSFDSISAALSVRLAGGTITGGSVNAGTALDVTATGALGLASATAGTNATLTAASLNSGALNAGQNLDLIVNGSTTLTGTAQAGGGLSITTAGLAAASLVTGGDLEISSRGATTFGSATATGAALILASSDSAVVFDSVNSGSQVTIAGRTISGRSAIAGGSADIAASTVQLDSVRVGGSVVYEGNSINVGDSVAGVGVGAIADTFAFYSIRAGDQIDVIARTDALGGTAVATKLIRVVVGGQLRYATLDGGSLFLQSASLTGGDLFARGGPGSFGEMAIGVTGAANVGRLNAAGFIGLGAGTLAFSTVTAGDGFSTSANTVSGEAIDAGRNLSINTQADLSLARVNAAAVEISSGGIVNLASLSASGEVTILADAVGLTSPGALRIRSISASNGDVSVTATGAISAQTIESRGDIALNSTASDVVVQSLSAGYADTSNAAVGPRANVGAGVIGLGDIVLNAARDIRIDTVADAANTFTANAGGTIGLNGLATGKIMTLSSSDIAIAATGQLGETTHTDAITLENSSDSTTLLGDGLPAQTSGYALSQAEFARIRSRGNLAVGGGSAMLVGNLAAIAQSGTTSGQIGETGRLALNSRGLMSFLGALSLNNAAGNTLAINGQDGIFLDATSGSIRLSDGQARAGTLQISGSGIAMVTRTALDAISGLTDTALITQRLSQNDGVTADRTLIEAEVISLQSDDEVYIQNTSLGTGFADRRGLVADTLSIDSRDGGTLDIVINGLVNGATGIDTIDVISFDEAFTNLSTVNGCVIANAGACNIIPFEGVVVRDVIAEVLDERPEDTAVQVADSFTRTTLIQLNQIAPAGFEPLIDEPVTGTGNDDLFSADDGAEKEDD